MRIKKTIKTNKLDFDYFVNINKDGLFTTYLPNNIVEKLESYGISVNRGRGNKSGYFQTNSMQELVKSVTEIMLKFSEKKLISTKIVLRYEITTRCSYCKADNGEIVPNGYWETKINNNENYHWQNGSVAMDSLNTNPFGFLVFVQPRQKKTWKYPDGETFEEYTSIDKKDIKESSTLDWLNSICSIEPYDKDKVKDIDYSEKVGLFFKNMLMYIFNLNEKLKRAFGKDLKLNVQNIKMIEEAK